MTAPTAERIPLAATLTFLVAVGYWATVLLLGRTEVGAEVATMAGAGAWLVGTVALVGLVVSRGRWALRFSIGLLVVTAIPAAATPDLLVFGIGVVVAAIAGWLLLGSTMRPWIRKGRSVDAPPDSAILLMLALVLWPLVGSPAATGALSWLLWAGPVLAFLFGRATVWSLWSTRVLAPGLPLIAAVGTGWPGWTAAVLLAVTSGWFAWQGDTRLAVVPLTGPTSDPQPVAPDFATLLQQEPDDA